MQKDDVAGLAEARACGDACGEPARLARHLRSPSRWAVSARKIQVCFSPEMLRVVDALRAASGRRTVAEVVRDALTLADWCRRQRADGFVIAAVKGDRVRELAFLNE